MKLLALRHLLKYSNPLVLRQINFNLTYGLINNANLNPIIPLTDTKRTFFCPVEINDLVNRSDYRRIIDTYTKEGT